MNSGLKEKLQKAGFEVDSNHPYGSVFRRHFKDEIDEDLLSLGLEKTICVCREGQKSSTEDKSCEYCEGKGFVFFAKWIELEQLIPKLMEKYPIEIEGTSGVDQDKE